MGRWQAELLGLRPVVRDVVQILGIRADLLKQGPLRLAVGQVLLALIFSAALFHQPLRAPNTFPGAVTEREIEFANQTARSEGGELLAESDDLLFEFGGSLARLPMRSPGAFGQTRGVVLLKAAQPFADGGHGGGEQTCGGFDAALLGALHQSQAMVVSVFHFTNQIEIASGGGPGDRIVRPARLPAPPPSAGRRVLPTASD